MITVITAAAGGFIVGAASVIGCVAIAAAYVWKDMRG